MSLNFGGRWNADLSRSRLLGPPAKAIAVILQHSDQKLRQEILITKLDDSEERLIFEYSLDGTEAENLLYGAPVRTQAKWQGDELGFESWLASSSGVIHLCDTWSLTPDGQTLTMEHKAGDLAGQIVIYDRAQ